MVYFKQSRNNHSCSIQSKEAYIHKDTSDTGKGESKFISFKIRYLHSSKVDSGYLESSRNIKSHGM